MAQDPIDPYFLCASNHPGLLLISQPLGEDSYHSWAQSMEVALNLKHEFRFVDGSIPRPPPDAASVLIGAWKCTNPVISSWL